MTFKTYNIIDLPDGTATQGDVDRRGDPRYFNLENSPLIKGGRVIEVAAFDAFWSFWAERAGAEYVLATDVERVAAYDWGGNGPPAKINGVPIENIAGHDLNFHKLKELLNSKVERKVISVYDHTTETVGEFDFVVCYGLIYHLRHPLLALDRLAAICRGAALFESHVPRTAHKVPYQLFYHDDVLAGNLTNWCGPSEAWFVHALRDAGFKHVFYENPKTNPTSSRQRFAGCMTDAWAEHMRTCPTLIEAGPEYFAHSKGLIKRLLSGQPSAWQEADE